MECMKQKTTYTYSEMIKIFTEATKGKIISSAQVKRLVLKGILVKIAPPGAIRGVYEIESVEKYAEELRKFYGVSEEENQ